MPNDPDYVRLTHRLTTGMLADVLGGSGWSISGMDVKEFPEDEDQARFVRAELNSGKLEPCSRAEYDEVHDEDEEEAVRQAQVEQVGLQESEVQENARRKRKALVARREEELRDAGELEDEEEARQRDLQERLDAQHAMEEERDSGGTRRRRGKQTANREPVPSE